MESVSTEKLKKLLKDGVLEMVDGDPNGKPGTKIKVMDNRWPKGQKLMVISNSSFQNGCARAEKEIQNKLQNAGMKMGNKIDDESMKAKGYRYKIELPPGMGEPLYTKDFNAAKEMAKEYGAGTKVTELR